VEEANTSEGIILTLRICIVNNSNSLWDTLKQCAYLKSNAYLIHALNCFFWVVFFKRVNHLVLKILFELEITLLKRFEVVVEEEQVFERLVTLFLFSGSDYLTLFKFFLLLNSLGFDTAWSINWLRMSFGSGSKFIILFFLKFLDSFGDWEGKSSEFVSKLGNFGATALIMDFFYHFLDCFVDIFAMFIVID